MVSPQVLKQLSSIAKQPHRRKVLRSKIATTLRDDDHELICVAVVDAASGLVSQALYHTGGVLFLALV